jgi:hypothetical protein
VRLALDCIETNVQDATSPPDLVGKIPKHAVLLDIDHYRTGTASSGPSWTFTLDKGELKEFIRTSWQRTLRCSHDDW